MMNTKLVVSTVVFAAVLLLQPKSGWAYGGHYIGDQCDNGVRSGIGIPIRPGEFPFLVFILNQQKYLCGGAVINTDTVVTAGSCFLSTPEAFNMQVRSGSIEPLKGGTVHAVRNYAVHPDFKRTREACNVAVVKVAEPFNIAPPPMSELSPKDGQHITVFGWPENGLEVVTAVLKYGGQLSIFDAWCLVPPKGLHCAHSLVKNDICKGMLGGPVLLGKSLVSVASVKLSQCKQGGTVAFTALNQKDVYDWIKEHTRTSRFSPLC